MSLLDADEARDLAEILRLFAQPQRLTILFLLLDGPFAVSEIEEKTGIGQPVLSQQLGTLRRAGIIASERDSRSISYNFANEMERARVMGMSRLFQSGMVLENYEDDDEAISSPRTLSVSVRKKLDGGAHFARVGKSVRSD
ncbi:MAG: metalloregulator ArsR/SmtB family transcription factor [Acetobacter sp.]|jgi:DNA-binding transcriptional ArsR family regulator|nr:metalloregulator ArsR/SmtB family transcription factor [Acetobacter sp.]MCH4062140.1 metalloregulator ArsR/SmtB family transcription factor [Acetobacter sp.]MCH4089013.1 metalloregulator ArsR/SmtB family transcription factor [Acetobacter sp.]MCI1293263.1 metalloregulator ArsR/SmtB family transcription factor [Acetobacter sp.]MCI1320114.1 metalloregulator ArsR/SmtB family transcription factor [Acetobacter sp.]